MKNKKLKIEFEIEEKDYVMIHKAEIRTISSDNKIFKIILFFMDKIGAITLGIFLQIFLDRKPISDEGKLFLVIAIISFCIALYAHHQKEKNIKEILEEKRKELEN